VNKKILIFAVLALLLVGSSTASVLAVPPPCPGTGTPGYWKNHPEEWADFSHWEYFGLDPGGGWTQDDVIDMLESRIKGDKTYTLFKAVVAAKLNYVAGNTGECWCVGDSYWYARMWLLEHGVGSGVEASSKDWKEAEPWYLELDNYNNGRLCVPSRDAFE
jgi:hypothetical protein